MSRCEGAATALGDTSTQMLVDGLDVNCCSLDHLEALRAAAAATPGSGHWPE